jgi:hypothetical protein
VALVLTCGGGGEDSSKMTNSWASVLVDFGSGMIISWTSLVSAGCCVGLLMSGTAISSLLFSSSC